MSRALVLLLHACSDRRMAYEEKFADFIRMCAEAKDEKIDVVVVADPIVLGDTHAEIVESLSRLAEAGLQLAVASPAKHRMR